MTISVAERPLLYRPTSAARELGISRSLVYALISAGRIRTVTLSRRQLVPLDELQRIAREGLPALPER